MQHLDEGTIHSWLDGALSADEAARVEAHVKECPECAAAVAEARGFIAGASRILTALDNAPRGVIPAAAPKKRIDPWILRVAATVLVVAAGTLVVVRNTGTRPEPGSTSSEEPDSAPIPKPLPTVSVQADPSRIAALGGSRTSVASPKKSSPKVAASDTSTVAQTIADDSRAAYSAEARAPAAQANIPAREKTAAGGQVSGAVVEGIPSPPANADAAAPTPQSPTTLRIRGVTSLDYASQQPLLKVVGTPRAIGLKITLYEVAPGDTVTLTEPMNVYLESVVVTGMSTARPLAGQVAGRSAAAKSAKRADTAAVSASDSQRVSANLAELAAAPRVSAPVSQVEVTNGVTTISWADGTTGKVLKLSGRMPEARLQGIKIRIERERAAAAAAAAKKSP